MSRNRNYRNLSANCAIKERVYLTSLKRHKTSDLFERDPFKIQSYNFHYADRPSYPIHNYRPPETSPSATSSTKTEMFYYNPNFRNRHGDSYDNDKENFTMVNSRSNNPMKFNEYRRRKFLYDFKSIDTTNRTTVKSTTGASAVFKRLPSAAVSPQRRDNNNIFEGFAGSKPKEVSAVTKSPLLRCCCKRDANYLSTARGSSTSCLAQKQSNSSNCEPLTKNQCRVNGRFTTQQNHLQQAQPHLQGSASQTLLNNNNNNNNINTFTGGVNQKPTKRPSAISLAGSNLELSGRVNRSNTPLNRCLSNTALNRNYSNTAVNRTGSHNSRENIANIRKSSSAASGKRNNTYEACTPNRRRSVLNATVAPTKGSCSGCEININISSMDDNEKNDNVRIQIETDGYLVNSDRTNQNNIRQRSNFALKPRPSLCSIVNIDKHLSKFSLKNLNGGGNANTSNLRDQIREDITWERERFAERERARERERERERKRELDREYDKLCWLELERNRERDRQQELAHENFRQIQIREAERQKEIDRKARQIYIPPPPFVPMTSHIYHQSSTERIPSMMPYNDPTKRSSQRTGGYNATIAKQRGTSPIKTASTPPNTCTPSRPPSTVPQEESMPKIIVYNKNNKTSPTTSPRKDIRAQRMQATTTVLNSPKLLKSPLEMKPSRISQNTTVLHRCTSCHLGRSVSVSMMPPTSPSPSPARARTQPQDIPPRSPCSPPLASRHIKVHKPFNAANPIQTTLNNVPIRITTSTRGSRTTIPNDVSFNTMRVRHNSMPVRQCRHRTYDESPSPYNVNINVYADNMKMTSAEQSRCN